MDIVFYSWGERTMLQRVEKGIKYITEKEHQCGKTKGSAYVNSLAL